jgi:hypothetical protein
MTSAIGVLASLNIILGAIARMRALRERVSRYKRPFGCRQSIPYVRNPTLRERRGRIRFVGGGSRSIGVSIQVSLKDI